TMFTHFERIENYVFLKSAKIWLFLMYSVYCNAVECIFRASKILAPCHPERSLRSEGSKELLEIPHHHSSCSVPKHRETTNLLKNLLSRYCPLSEKSSCSL